MSHYDHLREEKENNDLKTSSVRKLPPLPNNATARRFMELVEQYNLSCYEWDNDYWYLGFDLCEAKNTDVKDFAKHFIGSSICRNYLKLEGEDLKTFKKSLPKEKYEKVKFAPSLYLADWNTAYHYLVQGHSDTAKDFSNLAYDHFLKDLTSKDKGTNANNENLPPLPNNATARRFMELVEQYNLNCYEWVEKFWYIGSDLCEAKGSHKWDFANNFLGTNPKYEYLKLEGEDLKAFKKSLPQEKYEKIKFAPSLYLADWNTAYHYLVQGHSETAKDFSNLGADSVAESFNEGTQDQSSLTEDPILGMIDSVRGMRLKQLELEKEQRRQAEEQQRQAQEMLEQNKALQSVKDKQNTQEETLSDVLVRMAGFSKSLQSIKDAIDLETNGLPQNQRRKLESIVSPLGSYVAGIKVRESELGKKEAQKEAHGEVWREISKKLRYSDHGFALEARYQHRKREYEDAVQAWKAIGSPHGQKPTHLKRSRPDILEEAGMLEEAIEAAESVVFDYIQKVDS